MRVFPYLRVCLSLLLCYFSLAFSPSFSLFIPLYPFISLSLSLSLCCGSGCAITQLSQLSASLLKPSTALQRAKHALVVWQGRLWMSGGTPSSTAPLPLMWSPDGVQWSVVPAEFNDNEVSVTELAMALVRP